MGASRRIRNTTRHHPSESRCSIISHRILMLLLEYRPWQATVTNNSILEIFGTRLRLDPS